MEIVKNIIGDDCWGIIIDYLVGDKQYNIEKWKKKLRPFIFKVIVCQFFSPSSYLKLDYRCRNIININSRIILKYCYHCYKRITDLNIVTMLDNMNIDIFTCNNCIRKACITTELKHKSFIDVFK